jgi:PAS domain S-box-containing protein
MPAPAMSSAESEGPMNVREPSQEPPRHDTSRKTCDSNGGTIKLQGTGRDITEADNEDRGHRNMRTRSRNAEPKIIVVEDDQITARHLRENLIELGYEVPATASSGEEALAAVAKHLPDLVLMDIVLEGPMDGVETAEVIRRDFHIPVVFLTAFSDSGTLRRAINSEPFGHILKPFNERDLHWTVQTALFKHKMEKRFRATVEGAGAGYFRIGEDGRYEDVNEAWLRMHGYASRDEALGRHYSLTQTDADHDHAERIVAAVLHGEVIPNGELSRKCKDGSVGYHTFSFQPVWEEGMIAGLEGFLIDMTERRKAEEALRASNEFNESLLATLPFGIDIVDEAGVILYMNKHLHDLVGHEALGRTCWSVYRDDKQQCGECPLLPTQKKRGAAAVETSNVLGGRTFMINHIAIMYKGKKALLEVFQDLTEQKRMEHQLLQAQKMEGMGAFVSGISHDFNNILNNILGFVFQLRKYSHDQAKVAKYTETIEKSATRGAELANQLLSFVRQKKREDELIVVAPLIDEVIALLEETLPKNIIVTHSIPGGSLSVRGGKGELYQVVLNLCLNARDAMPEGGTLSIEADAGVVDGELIGAVIPSRLVPGQRCVRVKVSDTGTGIPAAILDKIFDPFFTTKEGRPSTGLGLAVVYNIVKGHGGTIVLQSEEGVGTSFTVLLPVTGDADGSEAGADEPGPSGRSKGCILVVDDEAAMRELGRELLEEEGYDVLTAEDGKQAVEIYRERWKDVALVVLDLVMPRMDGGQAFVAMKEINPAVKAFFCTGYTSDRVIASLLSQERLRALQKPASPVDFVKMVREVLAE